MPMCVLQALLNLCKLLSFFSMISDTTIPHWAEVKQRWWQTCVWDICPLAEMSKSQVIFHQSGRKFPLMHRMVHAHHLGLHLRVAQIAARQHPNIFKVSSRQAPSASPLLTFPLFLFSALTRSTTFTISPYKCALTCIFLPASEDTRYSQQWGYMKVCRGTKRSLLGCFLSALAEGWWHSLIWWGVRLQSLSLLQIWRSHASRMSSCLNPGWNVTKCAYSWKVSTDFLKLVAQ